jgi:hypothetical protein
VGRKLSFDPTSGDAAVHLHTRLETEEEGDLLPAHGGYNGHEVELSGLPLKTYAAHAGHGA